MMETNDIGLASEGPSADWAIVEVYGHRRHVGRIREEQRFGTSMLRIDVPTVWVDGEGNRQEPAWTTHWYGGAAIFSITHTDEASVMKAAETWRGSAVRAIAPPEADIDVDDDWRDEPIDTCTTGEEI